MSSPRSFYDVLVVGTSLAALAAGALLARRGFRVAAIGHGRRAQTYEHDGLLLRRELAHFAVAETPAFRRVVAELALVPAVRRRMQPLDPLYQVVMPGHRLDVPRAPERLASELRREFPEIGRPAEDFYAALARVSASLDRVLGADVSYSPDGFFERRESVRATADHPFGRDGEQAELLSEFAQDHPFRAFIEAPLRFAGASDPDRLNALSRARLLGGITRGACVLDGGTDALRALFAEKIVQHGGDYRPRDRVGRIHVRRSAVTGVALDGLDETLGAQFVVSALDVAETQTLTGAEPSRKWALTLESSRPWLFRYVMNVVVSARAVPVGMAQRVFLVGDRGRPLVEENLLAIERSAEDARGRVVLTLCALLPRSSVEEGASYLRRVRERVMRALAEVVPFLDRHVLVVDSPHDGRPLQDRSSGSETLIDVRWSGAPEAMEIIDRADRAGLLGVRGMPCRSEVRGLLHVGRQTLSSLGAEGELLAALTVARLITRTDRSKEKLRRELWSKVEI